MYPRIALYELGKFNVPEVEHWVEKVTYTPEPPIVVRGSMNPWETERQREIYLAEEKAWKDLQAVQAQYRVKRAYFDEQMIYLERTLSEIENMSGGKSKFNAAEVMKQIGMTMVQNIAGNWYGLLAKLAMLGVDTALAISKQKKIKSKIRDVEMFAARIQTVQAEMIQLSEQAARLTQTGDAYRAMFNERTPALVAQGEKAYTDRQALERQRADALRVQNTMLRRQRGQVRYNDAI